MPYLYQSYPPQYVIDAATSAVKAAIEDAARLGLVWRIIPASVVGQGMSDPMATRIVLDGDTGSGRAVSMVGALRAGQRVWCVQVPPAGLYVMGVIGPNVAIPTTSVMTASATWTKPVGLAWAKIRLVSGGGQCGGAGATIAAQSSEGGGGGGGGYAESLLAASALPATVTVTVGAGGSAGGAGASGSAGGSTSFGALLSATGGGGGTAGAGAGGNAVVAGGAGGVGTGGNIVNLTGGDGRAGLVIGGVAMRTNDGGASFFGVNSVTSATSTNGQVGRNYGGGGGGTRNGATQAARAGAAGAPGIVLVEEHY